MKGARDGWQCRELERQNCGRTPRNLASSVYDESIGRGEWIPDAFAGWRPIIVVPRTKTARANPNFRREIAGGIADGQVRRQPRRQNFPVKEPMNEGRTTRKKKGRALREGTSRWGWERATKCERGKGWRFAPFPRLGSSGV